MSVQHRRTRTRVGAALCAGALCGCGDVHFEFAFVSIGGTINGLGSGLTIVIADNGGDFLTLNSPGGFHFPQAISSGSRYDVTVAMQPKGQACSVVAGSGIAAADITSITIDCATTQAATAQVPGNAPGVRSGAAVATKLSVGESDGWLFGGQGVAADGDPGCLNDLWRFDFDTRQWVWLSGADVASAVGFSGERGTAAADNQPPAREQASAWIDRAGNLWLFGGGCRDANGELSVRDDLWRFDAHTQLWTWISGSAEPGAAATPSDSPPARAAARTWVDGLGRLWLAGGRSGTGVAVTALEDAWWFDVETLTWTRAQ